uniref:hypothetical protein n=1 Tax=Halomonas sp. TaxID=1486246 RepID=UPI0026335E67|nr:hypothetical protein [Halomonas sp.]
MNTTRHDGHDTSPSTLYSPGPELWVADGGTVPFYGLPFPTRMVVIRLSGNRLWLHSPIELSKPLQQQLDALGKVTWLIAPNHLHHLFLDQWLEVYPHARCLGTEQVIRKRHDLHFGGTLGPEPDPDWERDIDQLLFTGSPLMTEAIFFHRQSHSLIVTDLIENFSPQSLTPVKRFLARKAGVVAPNGSMPLDWRLSFMFHKSEAREHLQRMLDWQPERLIMAHGEIVTSHTGMFLQRAFRWLSQGKR